MLRLLCAYGMRLCATTLFVCCVIICFAQGGQKTDIEVDLDLRARFPGVGASRTELHTNTLKVQSSLGSGVSIDAYADRKYGQVYVPQWAMVQKDVGKGVVRAGILRLPFGIYDYKETYASGLIDYPLARTEYHDPFSVDWGVPGIGWIGGSARMQMEATVFSGPCYGVWNDTVGGKGAALRLQTYVRGFILGASRWDGQFDMQEFTDNPRFAMQGVHMNGLDARYSRPHLLVKGEYIWGQSGPDKTQGGYVDVYYHLPKYQKFTLTSRLEMLRFAAESPSAKQITFGLRYAAARDWILAVNWRRNNGINTGWTPYAGRQGDVYLQIYRKLRL